MQPPRTMRFLLFGSLSLLTANLIHAQEAPPLPPLDKQPANVDGVEPLARGPVHEAYALPADQQVGPGAVAPKQPPEPIEEVPPDQKPEGKNVQWIPGYFQWEEEKTDFIWISGFWRVPPPGRVWVPGNWRKIGDGWQWVGGFWASANGDAAQPAPPPQQDQPQVQPQPAPPLQPQAPQPQAELQYLPEPPPTLENGPVTPAPGDDAIYVPGIWSWRGRYVWRPGFWIDYRPGWVWVPPHYRWTPCGYVFVSGYWDYPLVERGLLFSPVYITPTVYAAPTFVYTPTYVIREECMFGAFFVRRGCGTYYFGDYFGPRYASIGFTPWCGGFVNVGFTFGRGYFCDPLFSYYRVAHRGDPFWHGGIGDLYAGRYRGTIAPPPRTLVQQNIVVNNIVNNTTINNTVVNRNISNVTMLSSLQNVRRTENRPLAAVTPAARQQFVAEARQFRDVAQQRGRLESAIVAKNPQFPQRGEGPRSARLDVPKQLIARAQNADVPSGGPAHAKATGVPTLPKAVLGSPQLPGPGTPGEGGHRRLPLDSKVPDSPRLGPQPPRVGATIPRFESKDEPKLPLGPPKIEPKLPAAPKLEPKLPLERPNLPRIERGLSDAPRNPIGPRSNPIEPRGLPTPKIERSEPKLPLNLPRVDPKPLERPGRPKEKETRAQGPLNLHPPVPALNSPPPVAHQAQQPRGLPHLGNPPLDPARIRPHAEAPLAGPRTERLPHANVPPAPRFNPPPAAQLSRPQPAHGNPPALRHGGNDGPAPKDRDKGKKQQ
jgi:hypothetical protein